MAQETFSDQGAPDRAAAGTTTPSGTSTGTPFGPAARPGDHATAGDAAHDVRAKAGEVAEGARQQVQELASQAREQVAGRLEDQKQRATGQLGLISDALFETSSNLRNQDQSQIAGFVDEAAQQVERFSEYLNTHTIGDLLDEAERFARREPALFVGGAMLLGLFGARFFKSTRSQRRQDGLSYGGPSYGSPSYGAPYRRVEHVRYERPSYELQGQGPVGRYDVRSETTRSHTDVRSYAEGNAYSGSGMRAPSGASSGAPSSGTGSGMGTGMGSGTGSGTGSGMGSGTGSGMGAGSTQGPTTTRPTRMTSPAPSGASSGTPSGTTSSGDAESTGRRDF